MKLIIKTTKEIRRTPMACIYDPDEDWILKESIRHVFESYYDILQKGKEDGFKRTVRLSLIEIIEGLK